MTRCETCGRMLSHDKTNKNVDDGGIPYYFCSAQCEDTWKETIRRVSVGH